MTGTVDHLVVLHSVNGRHATKRIVRHPKTGKITNRSYDKEHHFRVDTIAVDGFANLRAALDHLTEQPFAFVIRGAPVPGANLKYCRRLLHPDRKNDEPATFATAARHWFAIDLDHIAAPPLTDPVNDPEAAIEYLIGRLPPELADASCWWQFTSSQSLPGHEDTLSARLWYWGAVPFSDDELTRWAAAANAAGKLIDPSLYRAVQAHYVAAPAFTGMTDPLPRRSGLRPGLEDEVVLVIPPADPKRPDVASGEGYEPGRGVHAYLAEIGGGQGFRKPIISAIASYIAINGSAADCEPLKTAIRAAVERGDPGGRSTDQIERYRSDEHLDDLIGWVRDHHGNQPPKGEPEIDEPPEELVDPEIPIDEPEGSTTSDARPVVRIIGGQLPAIIDRAEAILTAADPDIYAFGDQIVRPAIRPISIANNGKTSGLRLVPVAAAHMVERFTRCVNFQKFLKKEQAWTSIDCPREVAAAYLERIGLWRLPQLAALTTCPLLRADGTILDRPGFDAATGVLFAPQGVEFPAVAAWPTRNAAVAALEFLKAPFTEFPFVDNASRAVFLSALLSAVTRLAVPHVPCHAFDAPAAGTGKSKLVDCVAVLLTGRECGVVSQAEDETEFEKKLGAVVLAGDAIVSIDNCQRPVDDQFLCMLLTQPEVKIRILGLSKDANIPTNALIFANGNNFHFGGDMLRRGLLGRLDAACERPELRQFTTEDPVHLLKRERPQYVVAALTVLRAYLAAGQPQTSPHSPLGGFEIWSRLIRDGLIWLGESDPVDTIEAARAEDPDQQKLEAVVTQWSMVLDDRAVTTREVIAEASGFDLTPTSHNPNHITYCRPEFRNALLDVAGDRGRLSVQRLGNWLAQHKNKVVGQYRLTMATMLLGNNRWQVQRNDNGRWR
jgi:hypothetical protein